MGDHRDPQTDDEEDVLRTGDEVGEYRLGDKLGSGTFGVVYRAEHTVIGKAAAVKVLHRKFSSNRDVVSRFAAEARAVNKIDNRHIVDIFNFEGLLGWALILIFMMSKAGLIVAYFMHMKWERLALIYAIILPPVLVLVFLVIAAIEADYTSITRIIFFGASPEVFPGHN